MKIGLVNFTPLKYQVDTPYRYPLGGSESALCYLSHSLSLRHHDVILFGRYPGSFSLNGIQHEPDIGLNEASKFGLDALIIQNTPYFGIKTKPALAKSTKLMFWSQHDYNQPAIASLSSKLIQGCYEKFIFVSNWQKAKYVHHFQLDEKKCGVIKNAISPAFENLFTNNSNVLSKKSQPPTLAYTSTPFRGLNLLLHIFPEIRSHFPEAKLKVFSSMQVYQSSPQSESQYFPLYEKCRKIAGVEYLGSVGQTSLAKEMTKVSIFAYPNIFPETSCISALEAMAAGCQVVTSDLGALPETTAGFAKLISLESTWEEYAESFRNETVKLLDQFAQANHSPLSKRLSRQVEFVNTNCLWDKQAIEWERLIKP